MENIIESKDLMVPGDKFEVEEYILDYLFHTMGVYVRSKAKKLCQVEKVYLVSSFEVKYLCKCLSNGLSYKVGSHFVLTQFLEDFYGINVSHPEFEVSRMTIQEACNRLNIKPAYKNAYLKEDAERIKEFIDNSMSFTVNGDWLTPETYSF